MNKHQSQARRQDSDGYEWRLEKPADAAEDHDDWLGELSEMRGRIIFDHGHRPAFRCVDGTFADPDPVDAFAFHVTARASGKLVGCARIVRFADAQTRFTQALLGAKRLDEILAGLGSSIPSSGESGRWIVDPEHRGRTLGRYLMSGVYATARWLGLRTVLGWSGTHDRQDRAFMSMGWMPMADFPTFPAPQFDDEVKLMYFDVTNMKPVQADLSFRMAELLSLDDPRAQALVPSVGSRTGEAWFLP